MRSLAFANISYNFTACKILNYVTQIFMIVAYIRVSTDEQSSNFSLDAQSLAISNYAKLHSLKIDEVIRDIGSGRNLEKRPGIRALRARSSDTIIISAIL
jgi:DNA invertase Pin-like site-specific DNA recombinase